MWPASNAVLTAPGTALPRYQNACFHTGSPSPPSGAAITFFGVMPTPTIAASTPIDGIRNTSGTAIDPARKLSPAGTTGAGTASTGRFERARTTRGWTATAATDVVVRAGAAAAT